MISRFFSFAVGLLTASLVVSCGGQGTENQEAPTTFYFTAIPDNNESLLRQRFDPMADYLTAELGITVAYKPVTNYQLAVTAMTGQEVFLAWFGGLTGVQARARTAGQAIAQGAADAEFYSYFIAHPSSGLKFSNEFPMGMAGKTFTFGSKSSTSGRLMPEAFIRQHMGKAPNDVFKGDTGFTDSHNLTIDAVVSGAFQVGAVNGKTWETMKAEGKTGDAFIIWKTPTYADYNWSVPGDIDEVYGAGFRDKLQKALLALDYTNPVHKKILDAYPRKKFITATNDDYKGIKSTAESLGVIRG
jgi:phosphonate transport system substrate-binding protein